MNLFAYGTLMVPEIFFRVTGHAQSGKKAELAGYARFKLKGKHYPALVPAADETTSGILYVDLNEDVFKKLDAFEGEMYARGRVAVRAADDAMVDAYAYVLRQPYREGLSSQRWSLTEFTERDQPEFIRTYFGFDVV